MAIPVVAGRPPLGSSAASARATADGDGRARVRTFAPRRSYLLVLVALTCVALLSRVYTTNSLAGQPTSDEYLYGVNARDLARSWSSGQPVSLDDLGVEGRSVVVESAALSLVLPWDPITIGRTMQALFNALCIPMTFVLGREVGMTRTASFIGAVLLMAVPEFQELAWRFWTDSQATFVSLMYLAALIAFARRPSVLSGVIGFVCLCLLLLTKESAAVTFTPFLVLAIAIPVSGRLTGSGRRYVVLAVALVVVAMVGLGVLVARAPADLKNNALVEKTFGAGPLVLTSIRDAIPALPSYSTQLVSLIGPVDLGTGFVWTTLVGLGWLIAEAAVALVTSQPRVGPWVLGWFAAALVWIPAMVTPWRDLASLRETDPWIAVTAGWFLVVVGTVAYSLRGGRRPGWGLAMLGMVVVLVLAERLVISVTPKVSAAALTFRSLMPIIPLFAIVGGGGLWSATGALALLAPHSRWARPLFGAAAVFGLVLFWSPLLHERFSSRPLLGRVADRGADPSSAEGLLVQSMVDAEPWLRANLQPSDVVMAGKGTPRQLAWYADLGVDGMNNLIDLGSHDRTPEQRRQYILDRVGPRGVDYVVDFNMDWTDPGGDKARQWRQTLDALQALPNLETAYVVNDKFGYPVFYVLRNHGYVSVPHAP